MAELRLAGVIRLMRRCFCTRVKNSILVFAACLALAGCDPVPKHTMSLLPEVGSSPVLSSQTATLTHAEIRQVMDTSQGRAYRLGADDVIAVSVYGHPALDNPLPSANSNVGGALITSDGDVELALIGNVHLGGLTLSEARRRIAKAYSAYIVDPKVAVELVKAQSFRYYLLGEFTKPGVKYPVRQLTLLEALALGGSVNMSNADLYQSYVAHGKIKLPVDLHSLLVNGDLSQNIVLAPGDAIVVPSTSTEKAFVFGSVGKPGAVGFESGRLSLLQALSEAKLDLTNYTAAQLSRIHIIRSDGTHAEFMIVDAARIMRGKALPFYLQPGDIVFVPPTGIASWNQVLGQLIPSLSTVGDVLNPFVSIKFLKQ